MPPVGHWGGWIRINAEGEADLEFPRWPVGPIGSGGKLIANDLTAWASKPASVAMTFLRFERLQRGELLSIGWTVDGTSPCAHYRHMMAKAW